MFCKYCGKEYKDGQRFCKYCGTSLLREPEVPAGETPFSYEEVENEPLDIGAGRNDAEESDFDEDGFAFENLSDGKRNDRQKRRKRGSSAQKTVLIVLITVLSLVLLVLILSLITFFRTGSFHPFALAGKAKEDAEETISEEDRKSVSAAEAKEPEPEKSEPDTNGDADEAAVVVEDDSLFDAFLAGEGRARVSEDILNARQYGEDALTIGQDYTTEEIKEALRAAEDMDIWIGIDKPKASYARLRIHEKPLYAFNLSYEKEYESYDTTFILRNGNDGLEIIFAIDGWSRRGFLFSEEGVAFESGSGGAASWGNSIYAPNSELSYRLVTEVLVEGWSGGWGNGFYDDEINPVESLNQTMKEVSDHDPEWAILYIGEKIKDRTYYYYDDWDGEAVSQSAADYIDAVAAEHGFSFDEEAAADAAREEYETELGLDDVCVKEADAKIVEWTDL